MSDHLDGFSPVPWIDVDVFTISETLQNTILEASKDRHLRRANIEIYDGGIASAMQKYKVEQNPALIIIEVEGDSESIMNQIDTLAEYCEPNVKAIVIGQRNDVNLYRGLIDLGISEYLVGALEPYEVVASICRLSSSSDSSSGKTLAFMGVKGGVGSSTFSQNVAWTIANRLNQKIVLLDCDINFGSASLNFNYNTIDHNLIDALYAHERIDSVYLERMLVQHDESLFLLLSTPQFDKTNEVSSSTFDKITLILQAIFPYVMFDLPNIWTTWTKDIVSTVDKIYLVMEPDLVSLRNVQKLLIEFERLRPNEPPPQVIVNKIGSPKREELELDQIKKSLSHTNFHSLSVDHGLFSLTQNLGQMIPQVKENSKASELIRTLAMEMVGTKEKTATNESFLSPFLAKIMGKSSNKK